MTRDLSEAGECGLMFFGCMSASISHEIKNSLAIIGENAGLLEDIVVMSEKGVPINPERLKRISSGIQNQVRRADDIIRKMNRFAHSIDDPIRQVDLGEMLGFSCSLAERLVSLKGVSLQVLAGEPPVRIATRPFFLENVVWLCLKHIAGAGGGNHQLELSVQRLENEAVICFRIRDGVQLSDILPDIETESRPVLPLLQACLTADAEHHQICLRLPQRIEGEDE